MSAVIPTEGGRRADILVRLFAINGALFYLVGAKLQPQVFNLGLRDAFGILGKELDWSPSIFL
ncbi:MAG: hypothetical protein SFY80_02370 [Verrucomicrobiota bacterium]|nr:hypothetical protein [Verrucomicrobiota bacterium]